MKAIVTVGVPASGKSTFALEKIKEAAGKGVFMLEINRDNIRKDLFSDLYGSSDQSFTWDKWNWGWESKVTKAAEGLIQHAVDTKLDIIISDTNLNPGKRNALVRKLTCLGFDVSLQLVPVSLRNAILRDVSRDNPVGEKVIRDMYNRWVEQFGEVY